MKHTNLALAMTLAAGLGGACSDDSAPTRAAYCETLAAQPEDEGGPIDEIFELHGPDPTLEQWADFLPGAIDEMSGSRDDFADIEPSDNLADEQADVLAAFDVVIENFEASQEAAAAGDETEFRALEAQNQDEDLPAMFASFEAVGAACESAAE